MVLAKSVSVEAEILTSPYKRLRISHTSDGKCLCTHPPSIEYMDQDVDISSTSAFSVFWSIQLNLRSVPI